MAYYSLFNRTRYKNWKPFDMIGWYSHQLYLEWFNSLPEEDKEYLKMKKKREYENFMQNWAFVCSFLRNYRKW